MGSRKRGKCKVFLKQRQVKFGISVPLEYCIQLTPPGGDSGPCTCPDGGHQCVLSSPGPAFGSSPGASHFPGPPTVGQSVTSFSECPPPGQAESFASREALAGLSFCSNGTHSLWVCTPLLELQESSEAWRGPNRSREGPLLPRRDIVACNSRLSQIQNVSRLHTAFKDTLKISPELEQTHQAALS